MSRKPTKEEIDQRILESGVDAYTDDVYINAKTPMEFYCSKGHSWKTKLGNVTHNHQGCPYCSGRYPIIGETDLYSVYPEVAQLLVNTEDGYRLSKHSGVKTEFKCPNCGTISKHIISNVVKRGFSCPACSDGISYPNKFMANTLLQLNIAYVPEFLFSNSRYQYDFYLPEYNTIIEMHGRQHYEEWSRSSRTLEEEQKNDKDKMEFAIKNNIKHYIVIDAKNSDINYISNNILESELNIMFDLSNIDWRRCGYYASGSLVHKAAILYNKGYSAAEIANELKCDQTTVRNYLKKATNLKLCEYIPSKGFLNEKHSIILLNTQEKFDSISDAGKHYNIPVANISANCIGKRKYAGIHPITNEPMVWKYIEEYNGSENIDFMSLLNPRAHRGNNTKLNKGDTK